MNINHADSSNIMNLILEKEKKLFFLNLQIHEEQLKKHTEIKKIKNEIARLKTKLNQR